jgi:hypothetical protein
MAVTDRVIAVDLNFAVDVVNGRTSHVVRGWR